MSAIAEDAIHSKECSEVSSNGQFHAEESSTVKQLFLFATTAEKCAMLFSCLMAAAAGLGDTLATIIIGDVMNGLNDPSQVIASSRQAALNFLVAGVATGIAAALASSIPIVIAERQMKRLRHEYYKKLLNQESKWFDSISKDEISNHLIETVYYWKSGISSNIPQAFEDFFALVCGFTIGFYYSWRIAFLVMAVFPIFIILSGVILTAAKKYQSRTMDARQAATACEDQVFNAVRTVAAFGSQRRECDVYSSLVEQARKATVTLSWIASAASGAQGVVMVAAYAYSMYVGGILVRSSRQDPACDEQELSSSCVTGGSVLLTFMVVSGAMGKMEGMVSTIQKIGMARVAAAKMLKIIKHDPTISCLDDLGSKTAIIGRVEFRDVCFKYPARPDVPILSNFNLIIEKGTSLALVGTSGSGKSTIAALLMRMYDPDSGSILVDSRDIKEFNVEHLREAFGVVDQEPLLFSLSVRENVALGNINVSCASDEDIQAATIAANAHDFIMGLSEGYHTIVGTSVSSVRLSGGQRQRLCIARCLLRKPAIMIFDEATSALDNESERQVQASIDSLLARSSRPTTLVIAHRLSTVVACDVICVLEKGRIVQQGTHAELMADTHGTYHRLQTLQQLNSSEHDECTSPPDTQIHTEYHCADMSVCPVAVPLDPELKFAVHSLNYHAADAPAPALVAALDDVQSPNPPDVAQPRCLDMYIHPVTVPIVPDQQIALCSAPAAGGGGGAVGELQERTSEKTLTRCLDCAGKSEQCSECKSLAPAPEQQIAVRSVPAAAPTGLSPNASSQASPSLSQSRDLQGELDAVSEKRLWKMQMPEIRLIVPALILSAAKGGANSVIGLLIADSTSAFYLSDDDMEKQLLRIVGYFMGCGVALFITNVLGQGILSYSAEALSARLRVHTFRHLMTMEMGFFDEESHSPGALQARLSYDAFAVQAASGKAVSQLLYSFGAMVVGLAIALQASWRIGLIILATTPLTIASGYYMIKGFQNSEMDDREAMEKSNHVACESITAIRTVRSLNLQKHMVKQFDVGSHQRYLAAKEKALRFAAIHFVGNFLQNAVLALTWFVGGIYINNGDLTFAQLMQAFLAVQFAGDAIEESFDFGAEKAQAVCAAASIFGIIDRPSKIDSAVGAGEKPRHCRGRIEFKNVTFAYPTCPDLYVLRNFNLVVEAGESVALVGGSGSGKSSVIMLLLRFYDPQEGAILLDGVDIRLLNLKWLREHLGYVQQEPALFCGSIKDNIDYGRFSTVNPGRECLHGGCDHLCIQDGHSIALQSISIEDAARQANAHSFIEQLPEQYETVCGARGSQLSGGQMQRIAIARMLIRQAPIMLLDEATSALDSESELLVQDTLHNLLGQGRTSLLVAHRLSTVKGCSTIAVMRKGELIEQGDHEQLLQKRGHYWQLVESQRHGSSCDDP